MSEPFAGEIRLVAFNYAPKGWATCEGQLLEINDYPVLFSLLGTAFGGDGVNKFALPDLRGRVALGQGFGPGLSPHAWGEKGGQEAISLTVDNLPKHSHSLVVIDEVGDSTAPNDRVLAESSEGDSIYADFAAVNTTMDNRAIGDTGGSQPVNFLPPFLGFYFIIALEGLYPRHPIG